jgi:uncharacterized membrane protein YkvA (DUF1232 family)
MPDLLKKKAADLKIQTFALYLAYCDPRTPWFAKGFTFLIVAYALSPIDLIPDFIPLIGYLDDLLLIPLGIILAMKMIPEPVMKDCQARARTLTLQEMPHARIFAVLILCIGIAVVLLIGGAVLSCIRK